MNNLNEVDAGRNCAMRKGVKSVNPPHLNLIQARDEDRMRRDP